MNNFKLLQQYKDYRYFWCSNFMSNLGIWIQIVASGIYMSELSSSPLQISLVQVMATLPIFLFSVPFGVLADIVDIYRLLSLIQIGIALIMLIYSLMAYGHVITPAAILLFTALIAIATAARLPTGQAAILQTVPKEKIKMAAILNNFGFSLARAGGPFIAGILFFYLSPYHVFAISTVLFFLAALYFLSQANKKLAHVKKINKNYFKELIHGFNYVIHSKHFILTALSSFLFFFFSNGVWSIIPYFAKYILHYNAKMQGAMTGMIGIGSILTGIIFPTIRERWNNNKILMFLFVLSGGSMMALLLVKNYALLLFFTLIIFGFAWASAVAFFNGEIQSLSPIELRSRLISIYFFIMYGGMALGSYALGKLLLYSSLQHLVPIEGILLIICGVLVYRYAKVAATF